MANNNQAKVAAIYAELQLSTAKFKAALQDATSETRKFSAQMRSQMRDAQGSVRLVSEELGVHVPRALQGFIARLPGVAKAMSAAFNAVAIFALVNIVAQAGQQIAEFVQKARDAAKKNAEAWRGINQPLIESNDELKVLNDKLANSIAKLEHKPQNGLKEAIDEAVVSADKLSAKLDADLSKIAETLKSSSPGFTSQLFGEASADDLKQQYADLQSRITQANVAGNQRIRDVRSGPGTDAQRQVAVDNAKKALSDSLLPLFEEGAKTFGDALKAALAADVSERNVARAAGLDPTKLNTGMASRIQAASSLTDLFNGQRTAMQLGAINDALTQKNDVLTKQKEDIEETKKASAELLQTYENAFNQQKALYGMSLQAESNFWRSRLASFSTNSKEFASVFERANEPIHKMFAGTEQAYRDRTGPVPTLAPNRSDDADNAAIAKGLEQQAALNAAITEAATKYRLETGAISEHTAALIMAGVHVDEYKAKLTSLNTELAQLQSQEIDLNGRNVDPENAAKQQAVQNQINDLNGKQRLQQFTDAQATLSTTWKGMVDGVFDELIRKSKDTTDQFRRIASSMTNDINSQLARAATGQRTNFRGVFQQGGESLAKTGIGKLEGLGLSALGFGGGKRDGSSVGSALYVQNVDGSRTTAPSLSSIFGSKSPNVTGPGGSALSSSASKGLLGFLNDNNWASGLFGGKLFGAGSIFGGGMALGGYTSTSGVFDVGEFGRERIHLPAGAHVTPNKDLAGSGVTQHIDARGTDPVMVHDAVVRANRATYTRAVHDAGRAMAERQRRTPR